MELLITPSGAVRCLYTEEFALDSLGPLVITRASQVEPTPKGQWTANLSLVGGPLLGPFAHRSAALAAERYWLESCWLCASSLPR